MPPRVDYQARLRYLISEAGSEREFFRQEERRRGPGLKRATMYRIRKGEGKPSKKVRDLINRRFRQKAPEAVRGREREGFGPGFALVDEDTARAIERSYQAEGLRYAVVAHQNYDRQIAGIGEPTRHKEYGKGATVDEAKANLEANFTRLELEYNSWRIERKGAIKYRVYIIQEGERSGVAS